MKTLFALSLLAASLAAPNLPAQVLVFGADPLPEPEPVPLPAVVYETPVVYQAPVIYQAPVVYQAPVIYQAPVVYQAPAVYRTPVGCQPPPINPDSIIFGAPAPDCSVASPTVIYFGGPGSECRNSFQCNPASPVIYFGRGESLQRGYNFTHPR